MTTEISVFVRDPIHVTLHLPEGRAREVVVRRVPARHSAAWDAFWASLTPEFMELTPQQSIDQELRFVKAGIPEPRESCPPHCACAGNRGIHADIDVLGREELDRLFFAVQSVNSPKEVPDGPIVHASVASGAMRRSLARSPRAWMRALLSTSRSRSSVT